MMKTWPGRDSQTVDKCASHLLAKTASYTVLQLYDMLVLQRSSSSSPSLRVLDHTTPWSFHTSPSFVWSNGTDTIQPFKSLLGCSFKFTPGFTHLCSLFLYSSSPCFFGFSYHLLPPPFCKISILRQLMMSPFLHSEDMPQTFPYLLTSPLILPLPNPSNLCMCHPLFPSNLKDIF